MDVKLPHLGEGAVSGTVVNLFVKEGDSIAKDQPVLELENEKAVATIPATDAGTVSKIFVKTGDKISVGQRILSLTETGGPAAAPAAKEARPAQSSKAASEARCPQEEDQEEHGAEQNRPATRSTPGIPPAAAPSIRKL